MKYDMDLLSLITLIIYADKIAWDKIFNPNYLQVQVILVFKISTRIKSNLEIHIY